MYKINHKVIFISILTQLAFGFFWLTAAPSPFISTEPDTHVSIVAVLSIASFVYFFAWLMVRMRFTSRWEVGVLGFSLWLFCILPNLLVAQMLFDLNLDLQLYLIAFSAAASFLNVMILPWSAEKSTTISNRSPGLILALLKETGALRNPPSVPIMSNDR